ncbi:hypothetical protein Cgig2_018136 [Carnegiea gigantea]|uniref:K-box domain-containing protein n=1 Tax=Carnegiea gigantea TaxID=171969 RepID=A0A9Q1KZR9_9CARY|nr:hypothetical protein Cgig2_018136 [Carnegiea gigantea]
MRWANEGRNIKERLRKEKNRAWTHEDGYPTIYLATLVKTMFWISMLKTLERYQKSNFGAPDPAIAAREALELSSQQEYLKLKARYEAMQRTQRNLLGEDLGHLSSKELESLEMQLDMSLKQIRATRTQCMLDQLTDLQRKEYMLHEANRTLKHRLIEASQASSLQWSGHEMVYDRQPSQPHPYGFFQPLECQPTLQIGYATYNLLNSQRHSYVPWVHGLSNLMHAVSLCD